MVERTHFILYVADQAAATAFWRAVLDLAPSLDVPGMTEFMLGSGVVLGLMPEASIRALLGAVLPDPPELPTCQRSHHHRRLAALHVKIHSALQQAE